MITPFNLSFLLNLGCFNFGIIFPKGIYVHLGEYFLCSKDGINHVLENHSYGIGMFFLVRILSFVDSLMFLVTLPIMAIIYTISFLLTFALSILLLPVYAFIMVTMKCIDIEEYIPATTTFIKIYYKCLIFMLCSFVSLLVLVGLTVLVPLSLLIPELTVLGLKTYKWGLVLDM